MVRKNQNKRNGRPRRRRPQRPTYVLKSGTTINSRANQNGFGFQKVVRILAALPMIINSSPVSLIGLFDLAFNLYKSTMSQTDYYTGAYNMFKINPGCLVKQSPLLAPDGGKFTFPGYPISVRYLSATLHATNSLGSFIGKWAAVFIPFLEPHDSDHYKKAVDDMSFAEIAAMPHATVGPVFQDLKINYRMRDKTAYCARPRELSEYIGMMIVTWDSGARDGYTEKPANSQFNCEITLRAGFVPHVIFGPQHRQKYEAELRNYVA